MTACSFTVGGGALEESQNHLDTCNSYVHLHKGRDVEKNYKDKVKFFMDIMVERTKKKSNIITEGLWLGLYCKIYLSGAQSAEDGGCTCIFLV